MSRTRFLILLCGLVSLAGCGYGFVLRGGGNLGPVHILASQNQTALRGAAMVLDAHLESNLAAMGVSAHTEGLPTLKCAIVSATAQEITANPMAANRYRLTVTVQAVISDRGGKTIWQASFSDFGGYASGGQEENALDEACDKIANRIAQAIITIKI